MINNANTAVEATDHILYNIIENALDALKKFDGTPVGVKRYSEEVSNHIKLKNVKLDFLMLYKNLE